MKKRKHPSKKSRTTGPLLITAAVVIMGIVFCLGILAGKKTPADTPDPPVIPNVSSDVTDEKTLPTDSVRKLHFAAAGDNVMHASILSEAQIAAEGRNDGDYYFDDMYAPVADIFRGADIAFINQEAPVAGKDFGISGHPNFNAPEEIADTLRRLGFDIVNIANNHMLDMDTKYRGTGYKRTVDFWKTQPFTVIGGYESREDYDTVRIYESDGIRIALLSYTYGTNGNTVNPGSPEMVVPLINDEDITRQMKLARESADLVFVSVHWGTENTFTPTEEQKQTAKLLNTLGADVILGHHSHTVQPVEWLETDDGHRTLVYYSLGNLISTMLDSYNMVGLIARFDIVRDADGTVFLDETTAAAQPVVCHYLADPNTPDEQDLPTRTDVIVYPLDAYTEELAAAHGAQLYGSFTLDTLWNYVTDTVGAEFLKPRKSS